MYIFDEYLNDKDLDKRERAKLWRTSIGLQSVDNLRVSDFLIEMRIPAQCRPGSPVILGHLC